MDKGSESKDSSPAGNAGLFTMPSVSGEENTATPPAVPTKQAIFTPNPEVPAEASAGNAFGAQAGAFGASEMNSTGPAHPFFSNHPTQTFASGAGDIIINHGSAGRPKTSRKPLIIGGIIIAALVVVLVGVMLWPKNQTSALLKVLEENVENVRKLDETTSLAYYDDLSVGEVLSDYDHEMLNSQITQFIKFQKSLDKISQKNVAKEAQNDFQKVQARVNNKSTAYQQTLELYNSVYTSYKDRNLDAIASLANSEEPNLNFIYKRLSKSIDNVRYWQEKLKEDNCDNELNAKSSNCVLAEDYLDEENLSFDTSTALVRTLFSTYLDGDLEAESLSSSIGKLIEVLK